MSINDRDVIAEVAFERDGKTERLIVTSEHDRVSITHDDATDYPPNRSHARNIEGAIEIIAEMDGIPKDARYSLVMSLRGAMLGDPIASADYRFGAQLTSLYLDVFRNPVAASYMLVYSDADGRFRRLTKFKTVAELEAILPPSADHAEVGYEAARSALLEQFRNATA